MTNNNGWVSASGETPASSSNLLDTALSRSPNVVVGQGGIEVTGYGPVKRNAPVSYTSGQEAPPNGSIIATAKTPTGGPIGDRNPNGKDIVSIRGITTSIEAAVMAGLLIRNGDGSYSDPSAPIEVKDPTTQAKPQAPREAAPDASPEGVSFGEEADTGLQELIQSQNPGDLFKMVDSVLHHNAMDERALERMASMAGVEPEEMRDKVDTVWKGAYDAGMDIMAGVGVEDEDAFFAYIAGNPQLSESMNESARNFFIHHNKEGLIAMAESYLPHMDRYETDRVQDMLTEAGYAFEAKPGGGLNILTHGTKVSWEVAVKQSMITFSRGES